MPSPDPTHFPIVMLDPVAQRKRVWLRQRAPGARADESSRFGRRPLLDYRQIGNVVITVSQSLPDEVPNNVNAH